MVQTRKRFVIFPCRYFKLSWNTTALSQSNCRNYSCSSILIIQKICNHVTVHRPTERRPGKPMFTFTLSNYFGSPGGRWLHLNVVINWQLSKQGIRWPLSPGRIAGSGVDPLRSSTFLKLSAYKLLVFKWSQAQVYFLKIYMKFIVFMSRRPRTIKILISN